MSVATSACPSCAQALEPGDRFCGGCGQALPALPPAGGGDARGRRADELAHSLAESDTRVPCEALLAVHRPFCRACGAEHDAGAAACPACGHDTAPLPSRLEGELGTVHAVRRGLRKRSAVRIGTREEGAELLLESGEVLIVELPALPDPASVDMPAEHARELRTPSGALLQLAAACRARALKASWDPDRLVAAALDGVGDETSARLVALDALAVGDAELIERLPLTASEQAWLRALDAFAARDATAAVAAIGQLPAEGYRPKLALLAGLAREVRAAGVDLGVLEVQTRPFRDEEPLAALLRRTLGLEPADAAGRLERAAAGGRALLGDLPLPQPVEAEISAGLAALAGEPSDAAASVRFSPPAVRTVRALAERRSGLLESHDVDRIPLPLLDDLIDDGAVAADVVLAGTQDAGRARYLTARLVPQRLTDGDVAELEHADEIVRRAFQRADVDGLAQAPDRPLVLHYRALAGLRRGRVKDVSIEHVQPGAQQIAAELVRLAETRDGAALPAGALTESVLADPSVWPVLVEIVGSTRLQPTAELRERFPAFTEWLSLHQAREHLFVGEWRAAVDAADRCLALAHDEAVCDEALNLKACGLHHLGDDRGAIAALEEAIQGAYSEALLANIGVVAVGFEPETAARHLGVLMREAPTTAMRVAAARRALTIWSTSDTQSWRNSDESPLPDAFQDALRELVVGPLALDDFRDFASLLAIHDSTWFGDVESLASSPHRETLEARFFVARAQSLHDLIPVMGASIASGAPPPWLLRERDSLRNAAVDILFENMDEPDTTFGSVALAMADHRVLVDAEDHLLLSFLGVASVTYHLSAHKDEVGDQLVARLHQLRRDWQQHPDAEVRRRLEPIVELATRRIALNRMSARDREMEQAIDVFNDALDVGSRVPPGTSAYADVLNRISVCARVASDARDDLLPFLPIVDHAGAREDIEKTVEMTRELERRCLNILN